MAFKKTQPPHSDDAKPRSAPQEPAHATNIHDESNWLISYADMMTLLCGFFIMLFSMAKLDDPQYDSFKEAVAKQFGGEYVSATKELAHFATQLLQELGLEKSVVVKHDSKGVSIVFESTIFFNTLSSDVTPEGKKILDHVIESIMSRQKINEKSYRIIVEGHTDGRPITAGIYPSNWELSSARAARVVRMFLNRGFAPDLLTAIGYADTHPLVDSRTPLGKWDPKALAQNRRVVLRILEPTVDTLPLPDAPPQGQAPPAPLPASDPAKTAH